jgi:hypothetical protein
MIPITLNEQSPFNGITFFASSFSVNKNAFIVSIEKVNLAIKRHTKFHKLSESANKQYQKIVKNKTVCISLKKVFPIATSCDTYGEI